jgi:hypothetical protein
MEKLSSLVIRTLTHQSPKLKVSVLRFLEKIIHTKIAYPNKNQEILGFLEEIKKNLFSLMSNANKQVRDAFFNFKKFLIEQGLMDDVPPPQKNPPRAISTRKLVSKRTLSSMRNIQPKKKGMSQSKKHMLSSRNLLHSEVQVKRRTSKKRGTLEREGQGGTGRGVEFKGARGVETNLCQINLEDSIYAKKTTKNQKQKSFFLGSHMKTTPRNKGSSTRSKVKSFINVPDLELSSSKMKESKVRPKARTIHPGGHGPKLGSKTARTMKGSGSTRDIGLGMKNKGMLRITSSKNIGLQTKYKRRATANAEEREGVIMGSRKQIMRKMTHQPSRRNIDGGVNDEYLGQMGFQNVYDRGDSSIQMSGRRNTRRANDSYMGTNKRKMSRKQSKNSFSMQQSIRKQSSVRKNQRGNNRSMSRNMSQKKGGFIQELPDDTPFEEIEFEHVKLNQLLDFVLRNFYRVESELTLNILLRNILQKFTKPKEILRNARLSSLIKRASSSSQIPVTKTTLRTLNPYWKQLFLNTSNMHATIESLFEVLLRKVGPIEFFDFFIELLLENDTSHNNLLSSLFDFVQRISPVLLTHKQIIVLLRCLHYLFKKTDQNQKFSKYLTQFVRTNLSSFQQKYGDLEEVLGSPEDGSPLPKSFQDNNYLLLTKTEQYELSQQIYIMNSDPETWDLFSEYVDFEKSVGLNVTLTPGQETEEEEGILFH